MKTIRIGNGFDVHQLVEDRELWICGVKIDYNKGLLGHSDADVAIHALCDALLGAAALRDIGFHFPDNDETYKNVKSRLLLDKVRKMIGEKGFAIGNVDLTIVAQAPKMQKYIPKMIEIIASDLMIPEDCVSIKATTTEHLGFTGRGEGIAALASATIYKS